VLYSFCAQSNCVDGAYPASGLVLDQKGNLFGTTYSGGAYGDNGGGVVFKLTPQGKRTVLYSFCAMNNCTDGVTPMAGLVLDQKGNLYGTTYFGGTHGLGVVFKLTQEGKETVLHSFCARDNCTDGQGPLASPVFDQKRNLYGTTWSGGAYGYGTVFKVTPQGKETVVYSFCARGNRICEDGARPLGLVFDYKGNLYGTAAGGGTHDSGVVFKLTPEGKETVLYSFCEQTDCTDGSRPDGAPVFDHTGNLYGTADGGTQGYGVVFKLTPEGNETVLYSFCEQTDCTDGREPTDGVVFDHNGNLYGTTYAGRTYDDCKGFGCGVVFKLTPKGKETVLYSFCAQNNCADGVGTRTRVLFDQKGNLYGTTIDGGVYGSGVVFKLTP
jgi:uncharacterized repeat protein (TIGR03803 family)